ncbi:hypothetical protein BDF22DRAFT_741641 [Syncephalis plumigaleata]|nr:hypothetical protein BDF22DRAFT_741641 [Syncephalis plumigaleata]
MNDTKSPFLYPCKPTFDADAHVVGNDDNSISEKTKLPCHLMGQARRDCYKQLLSKDAICLPTEVIGAILDQLDLPTLFRLATEVLPVTNTTTSASSSSAAAPAPAPASASASSNKNKAHTTTHQQSKSTQSFKPLDWIRKLRSRPTAIGNDRMTSARQQEKSPDTTTATTTTATTTTNTKVDILATSKSPSSPSSFTTRLTSVGLRQCARHALIRHFSKRPPILLLRFSQENGRAYHIAFCLRAIHPTAGHLLFTPMLATGLRYTYSRMNGLPQCRGDGLEEWCQGWSVMLPTPKYPSQTLLLPTVIPSPATTTRESNAATTTTSSSSSSSASTSSNATNAETNQEAESALTEMMALPQTWQEHHWRLVAPQDKFNPNAVAPDTYSIRRRHQRLRILANAAANAANASQTALAPTASTAAPSSTPSTTPPESAPMLRSPRYPTTGINVQHGTLPTTRTRTGTASSSSAQGLRHRADASSVSSSRASKETIDRMEDEVYEWPAFGWHTKLPVKREGTVIVPVNSSAKQCNGHFPNPSRIGGSLDWFFHKSDPQSFASLKERTITAMSGQQDEWTPAHKAHGLLRYSVHRNRPDIGPPPTFPRPRRNGERWIVPEGFLCDIAALIPPPVSSTTTTTAASTFTLSSNDVNSGSTSNSNNSSTSNGSLKRSLHWFKHRLFTDNANTASTVTTIPNISSNSSNSSNSSSGNNEEDSNQQPIIAAPTTITSSMVSSTDRLFYSLADVVRQTQRNNSNNSNNNDDDAHDHDAEHDDDDDDDQTTQSLTESLWLNNHDNDQRSSSRALLDHTRSAPSILQYPASLSPTLVK